MLNQTKESISGRLAALLPISFALLLVACGGGGSSATSDEAGSNDLGVLNSDGANGSDAVDGSTVVNPEDATSLQRLAGSESAMRVWLCERTEEDGSVRDTLLEFGELPDYDTAWMRFINPAFGRVEVLYTLQESDDRLRLTVPGIHRVAPFLQSESDSRTRRFVNMQFDEADFTADYQEFSVFNSFSATLDCQRSTQALATSSEVTGWPEATSWPGTPGIYAVEGLRENSNRRFLFADRCNDGSNTALSFYESYVGVETGAGWGIPNHYIVTPTQQSVTLSCAYGTFICYSAEPLDGRDAYWGLEPDLPVGARTCDDCCYSCPVPLIDTTSIAVTLTCN